MSIPSFSQLIQEVKSGTHTDNMVISRAKFFTWLGMDFINFVRHTVHTNSKTSNIPLKIYSSEVNILPQTE
jgi:hypothetical protein